MIFNAQGQDPDVADAYYWISRAYLAIENYDEAARNLEYFLANFPAHPAIPDALYQKGRLLYLQGDPESGIQVLEQFLREHPETDLAGSAYFWLGECLFSLGRLDEAARVFNTVIQAHPKSVKVEASRYRLSLIEFKKRENELLNLLRWSHEEALKSVEEFRRREKAYEQAIAVYQRKLGSPSTPETPVADAETAKAIQRLQDENEALKSTIQSLEARLETEAVTASGEDDEEIAAELRQRLAAVENRERALEMKSDALAVKEALLQQLLEEMGAGR
jgi:tetratricopeptide (TPR) repeat protein